MYFHSFRFIPYFRIQSRSPDNDIVGNEIPQRTSLIRRIRTCGSYNLIPRLRFFFRRSISAIS